MISIEDELDALRAATTAELVERYEELHGKPPRVRHKSWLFKRCAWKAQERRFGGLSEVAKRRLNELIAELDLPFGTVTGAVAKRRNEPAVGAVLSRVWRGKPIRVLITEDGVEWDGEAFTSLSAAAKAITGTRWNGRLFFGLTKRRKAP